MPDVVIRGWSRLTFTEWVEQPSRISDQKCPVCGHTQRRYLFMLGDLQLEACEQCDLVFQNQKQGTSTHSHKPTPTATEDEALTGYVRLLKQVSIETSFLLVAENTERVTTILNQHGCQIEQCLSIDDLATATLPSEHFSGAIFLYNLERLADPVYTLEKIRQSLKFNGIVLIVCDALDSWSARFFRRNWIGWDPGNWCYYDSNTIQSLLLRSGFSGIRVRPDYRRYSLQHIYERALHSHRQTLLTSTIKMLYHITPSFLKEVRVMKVATSLMVVTAHRSEKREPPMLSVIMPVYNERATVGETLATVLNKQVPDMVKEVIVVESNSTDGSRDIVLSYEDHPEVKIILEDRPRGKGNAVRTGLANASGDFILIQDADQEYDVNDYDILIEPLRTYRTAFVLGSRHTGGGKMREFNDQPGLAAYFNFGHWLFCTALNLLYGQRMKDPFTMYKVFRRDCLHGLEFECNRFDFDFELVIKLVRKGYIPLEIPVNYRARSLTEGKKVTVLRDPLTWVRALVKFRFTPLYRSE